MRIYATNKFANKNIIMLIRLIEPLKISNDGFWTAMRIPSNSLIDHIVSYL